MLDFADAPAGKSAERGQQHPSLVFNAPQEATRENILYLKYLRYKNVSKYYLEVREGRGDMSETCLSPCDRL